MLGKRLLQLRKKKSITQETLGKALGVGKTTISNYETGYSTPDSETLTKIADYFGVTTDFLLGRKKINIVPQGTEKLDHFEDLVKMIRIPVYNLDVNGEEVLVDSNIIEYQYVPANQMNRIGFKVPDDSMSGSGLYAGYTVIVKNQDKADEAKDGTVVIAKTSNGHTRIRRIRYFNDEALLIPDNPRYQQERINISELEIIGVVTDAIFKVK